jgi:hypothetical protein
MGMVNLHAHSSYSDGLDSIIVMAQEYKELGHDCCVITDHVYSKPQNKEDATFSMSLRSFERACSDKEAIENMTGFPVIIGIELSISGYEEVCVFGRAAIRDIFEIRDNNGLITIQDLKAIKSWTNCAINLCHPMNATRFINAGGHEILDGYELIHTGQYTFPKYRKFGDEHRYEPDPFDAEDPYEQFGLTALCNSDAHQARSLYRCCNVFEDTIDSEDKLIAHIHAKRKIEFHVEPHRTSESIY